MLKQYNMMDRAAFIGFATTSIKEVKKTAPELAVGYLNSVNMKNFGDYQKQLHYILIKALVYLQIMDIWILKEF